MVRNLGKVVLCAALVAATSAVLAAQPIRFTSFDITGAANYFVPGINDKGTVVGSWDPAGGPPPRLGFIRSPNGHTITPVLDPNDTDSFTILRAINNKGVIAGFYGLNVAHGFLLDDGLFVPVDFPGALDTALRGINNHGDLSGTYDTAPNADQIGFIIPRRGAEITFGPPPGGSGLVVGKINDRREVVGYYTAANGSLMGFLREPNGRLIDIVVPGAANTLAYGINDCGIILGFWTDGTAHGFYGRPGDLQSFDLPGAGATFAQGLNNQGRVVGRYAAGGTQHGFVTEPISGAACDD
jgi:hypothetical protein